VPKARRILSLVVLVRLAWRRFQEERCPQIAASLAFTTLLAIVPVITVALTAISVFPVFRELLQYVERFLVRIMLPDSAAVVAGYAAQFAENAARLTTLGIALIFVTAVLVLLTIDRAFNQIWRVPRPRGLVPRIIVYWALLTVGPPLIGGSLALTSWLVRQSLGQVKGMPLAAEVILDIVPVLLTACAFTLAYVAIPNRRVRVRDALTGGVAAAAAFEATKHGFALYIAHFPTYTLVYGAFASVPIFLLWIYLSWVVVLLGAVTAAVMPEWRERRAANVLRSG
jgi:membrane protein